MSQQILIDHLFRHQYGKMVSILIRIFGLQHLEMIEDAVQDTFVKAMLCWREQLPENPEAWLMLAAKNRTIDLFRKLDAEQKRIPKLTQGAAAMTLNDLFLDNEIADSQLRMIFTACHPLLHPTEQLAFALKTISGFSTKEIASALLLKEDNIKKRLTRARKAIKEQDVAFEIPQGTALPNRLDRVLEVLYLIFNEGFHSNQKERLVREDLCGEALRLCKMLLNNNNTNTSKAYALFALMCFHAARLPAKLNAQNELVDLRNQDRSLWHFPLIELGNITMNKAVQGDTFSSYHYEAAIAGEHLRAKDFKATNWSNILQYYEKLHELQPFAITKLNMATILLQMNKLEEGLSILEHIDVKQLGQRAYLYYATWAEFCLLNGEQAQAKIALEQAMTLVHNRVEYAFLKKKLEGESSGSSTKRKFKKP